MSEINIYPLIMQGPFLRWQFFPVNPWAHRQIYPPSPVSMHVELLVQGFAEQG